MTVCDYSGIYSEMRTRNATLLKENGTKNDPQLLLNSVDSRRGIAYFVSNIQPSYSFSAVVSEAENYFSKHIIYYPEEKSHNSGVLHFTFMQILKVGDANHDLNQIQLDEYIEISRRILSTIPPFEIVYSGLIAIPTGIVISGHPSIDINPVRELLRKEIKNAGLPFTEPYPNNIAHSTFIRLSDKEDPTKLISFAEKYEKYDLGKLTVSSMSLGYGTWKMRSEECRMLATYSLRN